MTHPSLIKLRNRINRTTRLKLGIPNVPHFANGAYCQQKAASERAANFIEHCQFAPPSTAQKDPSWDFLNQSAPKGNSDHAST